MKIAVANNPFFVPLVACNCCITHAFAPTTIGLGTTLPSPASNTVMYASSRNNNEQSTSPGTTTITRRENLKRAVNACFLFPSLASARNLPTSTGADTSRTGSIDALTPVVAIRRGLSSAESRLSDSDQGSSSTVTPDTFSTLLRTLLKNIPREEVAFKRIFDAYSAPVSYKQKFLDQNAFLVYYTKGYDGPGRPNIEDDSTNNSQTLQYGSRNDAWAAMDDLFVELEFGNGSKGDRSTSSSKEELVALFDKVSMALDSYLRLAPVADVEEASRQLGQ